jgi:hypothetical protein
MYLEFLIALQARRIAELEADKKVGPITYGISADSSTVVSGPATTD